MPTPMFNDEPLDISYLIPNSPSSTFVYSKIKQRKIYCQECFAASQEKMALEFSFDGDRPVFSHDNCVANPSAPKPFEVIDGLIQVPITEEGWTWDPPLNIGDHCVIVAKYYHEWLFNKSEAKSHSLRIESAYDSASEWDSFSTLTVEKINGERAKVISANGITRIVPLKVLWTLETIKKSENLTNVLVSY